MNKYRKREREREKSEKILNKTVIEQCEKKWRNEGKGSK